MDHNLDRRGFLKSALLAGAGMGALGRPVAAQDGEKGGAEGDPTPSSKVPRKTLGDTGEKIPILLQGCAQKFDSRYDRMLHRGFKRGVDYLDTALVYSGGQSHRTLAPFIKQIGDRKKLWITSKAPHRRNRADAGSFERDLSTCLQQLETDYLDLFFMHALDNPKYVTKKYVQLGERLKKTGKIRFFGFSCHSGNVVDLMNRAANLGGGIDAIMFRYNFSQYGDRALNRAMDACKKANIGLIAMKTQRSVPANQEDVVKFQSDKFNLAQAKMKAVWLDERIDSAVSHMDNLQKLNENVAAAMSPVKLGMNDFQQLNRLASSTASYACQGCSQHCEPHVPGDMKVADTLRYLMYHECYGEKDKARELYAQLTGSERASEGVDFSAAASACPEGIDIAARLKRARELLA